MALPGVSITVTSDNLGRQPRNQDGLGGFILGPCSVAPSGAALMQAYVVRTLAEAEALGVTAQYDEDNDVLCHHVLKEFYSVAPNGTPVWFLISNQIQSAYWGVGGEADKLMNASNGNLKWVTGCFTTQAGAITYTNGLPAVTITAITNAEAWRIRQGSLHKPCRVILEGFAISSVSALTYDLKAETGPNKEVTVVIGQLKGSWNTNMLAVTEKYASVGAFCGRIASTAVNRNPGRVKDGAVGTALSAGFSDTTSIVAATDTQLNTLHDLGYVFLRVHPGLSGVYFNDGTMATKNTNDFQDIADGRVMDKARRITYLTYVEEVNDDVEIDSNTGRIAASVISALEGKVETALTGQMVGEISGAGCRIDPLQNVQTTNELQVVIEIIKRGTNKKISVTMGYALRLTQ